MKKNKSKKKVLKKNSTPDLPQNIVPVGERVLDEKNIYIHQNVYDKIHRFAANKTENEHGGILVGRVLNEMGKENTIIEGFIEARYNTATPTTLTFTHETWEYFHSEIERKYKDKKIVGWIHTHPNFGIFLSENDKFIQQNFFSDKNQVAFVVDPIQYEEGFFFWVDEKLEKCPGFYVFDKNGVKIKQKIWSANSGANISDIVDSTSKTGKIITIALIAITIINTIALIGQSNKIKNLNKMIENYETITEYNFGMGSEEVVNTIKMQRKIEEELRKHMATPVPEAQPQADPVPEAQPQADPVPEAQPQADPVPEAQPQSEPAPESVPQIEPALEAVPQQ